jgi:Spy/CpxP family protein refolding chaperone
MKDTTIALSIASVVTVLAGVYLYYGSSYVGHGSSGNSHGKNYSYGHGSSGNSHGKNYSKGHYGGHGHHGGLYHILRFKEQLGLTEDQVTQINNLKFEHEKKKIDFQRDHKIVHMEIERELNSETLNENKVRELASQIGNLKRKNIEEKFEAQLNIIRLLTTEQKRKVKQMHENPSEGSSQKIK